nr:MAG TPA: hypothetical protein [Caudoviricetes sp.]
MNLMPTLPRDMLELVVIQLRVVGHRYLWICQISIHYITLHVLDMQQQALEIYGVRYMTQHLSSKQP